jgi:hypothetical protein
MTGMTDGVDAKITADVVARLRQRFPNVSFDSRSVGQVDEVPLPSLSSSDYTFVLVFADDAEAVLEARLTAASRPGDRGFWYLPFDAPNYDSYDERANEIVDTVELVLGHRTRIVQKHGIIAWSVTAEVDTGGAWRRLSTVGSLNLLVQSPPSDGRRREYCADAFAPELRPVI